MSNDFKINYSIISRGTEKSVKHGYMCISKNRGLSGIFNIDHGTNKSQIEPDTILFDGSKYSIENIALSRFQIITSLTYERFKFKDNILITGCGNIGFSCLIFLLNKGYRNITILSRNKHNFNEIEKHFKTKISKTNMISNRYNTYIECSGDKKILEEIIAESGYVKDIVILSTIRDSNSMIKPIDINRKNLILIGGHELNGINLSLRNDHFTKLLIENKKIEKILPRYISISKFNKNLVSKLLQKKKKNIDIIKY